MNPRSFIMITSTRKVGKIGKAPDKSFFITLPPKWIHEQEINEGDTVLVKSTPDGALRIEKIEG